MRSCKWKQWEIIELKLRKPSFIKGCSQGRRAAGHHVRPKAQRLRHHEHRYEQRTVFAIPNQIRAQDEAGERRTLSIEGRSFSSSNEKRGRD